MLIESKYLNASYFWVVRVCENYLNASYFWVVRVCENYLNASYFWVVGFLGLVVVFLRALFSVHFFKMAVKGFVELFQLPNFARATNIKRVPSL
jgi:hypothetical protein